MSDGKVVPVLGAPGRIAGATAAVVATAALACGVCCVLPFALPAVALAVSGGVLAWFGRLHSWVTLVASVAVASAWVWIGWQSLRSRRPPARSTIITMVAATLVLGAAIAWPHFEGAIGARLRR